jgi:hypothetical protein
MKKWLCDFSVDKPTEIKKTKTTKDEDGKEIDVTKTFKGKEAHKFSLQKPTRKHFEEGELYYAVKLSEGIKAGLLTTAQVAKRYENDGGVYTEYEKKRMRELRSDVAELQGEYFELDKVKKDEDGDESTKEEKDVSSRRKIEILTQINDARTEISEIENVHQYIYDQTAEVKARNKTILWWILHLSHMDIAGKSQPLFPGEDIDMRLDVYDRMEDQGDDFTAEFLKKLAYYVSYWYVSKNVDQADFATVEALYKQASDYVVEEEIDEEEEAEKAKATEEARKAQEKAEEEARLIEEGKKRAEKAQEEKQELDEKAEKKKKEEEEKAAESNRKNQEQAEKDRAKAAEKD